MRIRRHRRPSEPATGSQGEPGDVLARCLDAAYRYLAARPRSELELRHRLARVTSDGAMVSACIERLREQRLADDSAFATFWVDQRQSHNPRSRAALRHELRSKGIRGEIAEAGLESCDDRTAATSAARRYLHRVEGIDRTTALRRLAGYLVRRGFSHGLAAHVAAGLL